MKNTVIALLIALALPHAWAKAEKPNIILFLIDDMGLMDTSVLFVVDAKGQPVKHPLNNFYRTPNMEKLAAAGTRFSSFYAHSVCSPTRASIMTGQNSARHRSTTWIKPQSNNRGNFGPAEWNWTGLDKKSLTLPRLLQGAGYRTIHVGKAHFGPDNHEGSEPLNLGFDVNVGGFSAGQPGSYYAEQNYARNGKTGQVPHLEKYHGTDTFLTEALTLEANRHIENAVKEQKPFFLHMSHYALHAPFESDPRFAGNYAQSGENKHAQAFATLVEGMDKSLGDLMAKLDSLGVADNTLIIFLGDNGSDAPLGKGDYNSSAPYRQKKGWRYEGGMLVPFIAAWAKANHESPWQQKLPIPAGAIQTQMGTILDLLPTLCNLAEVELPKDMPLDGYDLKPQFAGSKNETRKEDFLNHFPHEHRSSYFTSYVNDGWKVIYHYPLPSRGNKATGKEITPRYELFNLKSDPFEKNDLASTNPEKLQTIMTALVKDLEAKNALYPQKGDKELHPEIPGSPGLKSKVDVVRIDAAPAYDVSVPKPTLSNIRYGTHERNVLDFWRASSDSPTPLVLVIHGGGWRNGSKERINRFVEVPALLQAGISVTAMNYRYIRNAKELEPPVQGPLYDAARALQFVRTKAAEWNIDKERIGAVGSSAGACSSLWLAFHDDLADPESEDPVIRESTRLWCVAVGNAQTSLDPKQMREWTPNSTYGGHAFGLKNFDEFLAGRESILPWIAEYSPYELVSKDDPPVYLYYKMAPAMGKAVKDPTHSANFGVKLQERCQKRGVSCELVYPVNNPKPATDYLIKTLTRTGK